MQPRPPRGGLGAHAAESPGASCRVIVGGTSLGPLAAANRLRRDEAREGGVDDPAAVPGGVSGHVEPRDRSLHRPAHWVARVVELDLRRVQERVVGREARHDVVQLFERLQKVHHHPTRQGHRDVARSRVGERRRDRHACQPLCGRAASLLEVLQTLDDRPSASDRRRKLRDRPPVLRRVLHRVRQLDVREEREVRVLQSSRRSPRGRSRGRTPRRPP